MRGTLIYESCYDRECWQLFAVWRVSSHRQVRSLRYGRDDMGRLTSPDP